MISKERLALKEDLDDTKAQLTNMQRIKNELDTDVGQLRDKVTELTLREEDRAGEHEDLMNDITEKVKYAEVKTLQSICRLPHNTFLQGAYAYLHRTGQRTVTLDWITARASPLHTAYKTCKGWRLEFDALQSFHDVLDPMAFSATTLENTTASTPT